MDREHGTSDLIGPRRILIAILVTRRLINPIFILEAAMLVIYSQPSLASPLLSPPLLSVVSVWSYFRSRLEKWREPGCVLSRDIWHSVPDRAKIDVAPYFD